MNANIIDFFKMSKLGGYGKTLMEYFFSSSDDKQILDPLTTVIKIALLYFYDAGTKLTIYKNIKPERRELPKATIDTVIFTSPSTVNNFINDYKEIPKEWNILAKGTLTYNTLKSAGYDQVEINNE